MTIVPPPETSEMRARFNAFDWSQTPIGPVSTWPQSLKSLVKTLLASQYPMVLTWGPEYTQFYNDAYSKLIGERHPAALGLDICITLAEAWDTLGPMIEKVMQTGVANWTPALQLMMERSGYLEEAYFSVSHAPAEDDEGRIVGMLAVCSEVTDQVLGERRLRLLRELASKAGETRTIEATCDELSSFMGGHALDVPFALLYLLEADGKTLTLRGRMGLESDEVVVPSLLDSSLMPEEATTLPALALPLTQAARGEAVVFEGLRQHIHLPGGPWGNGVDTALLLPIASAGQSAPLGALVMGVSPNRALDENYRSFFELLAGQVSVALRNAQAHEEERRKAETLAQIDRAKTEFFSNVSHEFRTPLTLMLGPLEELLEQGQTLSVPEREQLTIAYRNSLRLLKLVNTLLDFSRLEAGRADATYQPTDLSSFTADLASVFRSAVERAGVDYHVDCPPLPEPVFVDRDMWEKIVLNLLSNAFKFTFDGEINLTLRWQEDHIKLAVRDTGTGIPPEELAHLFERFHRVRGARSRSHEGTGIGLSLVNELVALHGGDVRVESEMGQGTTFIVSLPTGSAHLPADRVADSPFSQGEPEELEAKRPVAFVEEALRWLPNEASPALTPLAEQGFEIQAPSSAAPRVVTDFPTRILLVDDNADMRAYVTRLLEEFYIVETASDGLAALEMAKSRPPDLVISDVMMPGLDGFALLGELRQNSGTKEVPIILLSARAGEESRIEGLERGADDYLIKPFSARELLATVDANLRLSLIRQEAAHKQIQSIIESISDSFFAVDREWRFTYINTQCEKFFGRKREELLGKVFWEEFPQSRDNIFERSYRQAVETQTTANFEAFSTLSQSWIEVHAYPRTDGLSVYFSDISQRKRDQQERERLLREAQEASRLKDEFLAIVSHELRTPLNAILGWANLLGEGNLEPEDALRGFQAIQRNARSQAQIIEDVLDISRIVTGKMRLDVRPVEISALLGEVIENMRPAAQAKSITLGVAPSFQVAPILGDPARLQQIFWNLLSNAVKFTPDGGSIEITVERWEKQIAVQVKDSGIGISPEFLPYVFDRFRQADMSSTRVHGGLGLGLSIVRQLVELHGGSVEVHSEGEGQGTTFKVFLPLVNNTVPTTPRRRRDDQRNRLDALEPTYCPPDLDGLRVLIIDDEADSRSMLSLSMQRCGVVVQEAGSMREALELFESFQPDALVSDIGMPDGDGYELIQRVRFLELERDHDPVPAMALTAYARAEDKKRALSAGFQVHVAKPIEPEAFIGAVTELVNPNEGLTEGS